MKALKHYLSCIAGILVLMFLVSNQITAQKKTEFAVGAGIPEAINFKFKYGINNKVGISAGIFPDIYYSSYDNKYYSTIYTTLSLDIYHYFKKQNDTIRSKWYCNSGISFWPGSDEKSLFLYLRFGRSINFSKKTGINIDLGLAPGIHWERETTGSITYGTVPYEETTLLPLPSCSISFFVRL